MSGFIDSIRQNPVFYRHTPDDGETSPSKGLVRNRIASRENEVFVAIGNRVQCSEVGQNLTDYKLLDLPIVNFEIRSLVINDSGSLLAVIGRTRLVVCSLPPFGFMSRKDHSLNVKCREVGPPNDAAQDLEIFKAIWNPIARYDSSLIVLTSDSVIRAYDLSVSYERPETIYSLLPEKSSRRSSIGLMDDYSVENPVSISLGTMADTYGRFTLYILSKGGDIHALCPFVPNQLTLTKEDMEAIFDDAVSDEFKVRNTSESASEKREQLLALSWVSDLWKQMGSTLVETRLSYLGNAEQFYVFEKPNRSIPLLQGPFTFEPFPELLYEPEAVDILATDSGAFTCLVISYDSGHILMCLQDFSVPVRWATEGAKLPKLNLSLAVSECFQPTKYPLSIFQDFNFSLNLILLSNHDAFKLDLDSWAYSLTEAVEEGADNEIDLIIDQKLRSQVTPIHHGANLFGVAFFHDPLDFQYLASVSNEGVNVLGLIDEENETETPPEQDVPDEAEVSTVAVKYESLLDDSFSEVGPLLDSVKLSAPLLNSNVSLNDKINQESLAYLDAFERLSSFYTGELLKLHKASLLAHKRLLVQKSELYRQLTKIGEIEDKRVALNIDYGEEVQKAIDRQATLNARADDLLQKLSQRRPIPISEQESNWFKELNRSHKKIYGVRGFEQRRRIATSQASVLINESKLLVSQPTTPVRLNNDPGLQTLLNNLSKE